ncbi:MAG: hypothetical protein HYY17_05610 [Planctomycetes bacterium]|nr:hypothetical protein [Planctomycetota bacterium]
MRTLAECDVRRIREDGDPRPVPEGRTFYVVTTILAVLMLLLAGLSVTSVIAVFSL